jgi:tetratricopeptide (TPR) repeat protein
MGSKEDFFGGYDYKAQAGIVHIANHHISPGKKQWTWGNHEFGYAWDRNLTDADARGEFAPYIEIMAGVYTDNQPDFSFLQPGETKTWSQYWYPIQKIGPAQHANLDAAISLKDCRNGKIRLAFPSRENFSGAKIISTAKGKKLFCHPRARPRARLAVRQRNQTAARRAETDLQLRVTEANGTEIISYQPKPRVQGEVPPPATEPPAPADIASADELVHHRPASRTISPRHALPDTLLARGVAPRSAGFALQQCDGLVASQARRIHRRGKTFPQGHRTAHRRNANPYDGEAYYNLGLCLRYLGRDDEAYDAFYKATGIRPGWRRAITRWRRLIAAEKLDDRAGHLNRSLRFNTDNLRARNLKAIVCAN